jgi:hypothetical protein
MLPTLWYRWIPRDRPTDFKATGLVGQQPGFFIQRGVYRLYAGGNPISANEYLSPSKGVSGNITGFFEYEEYRPKHMLDAFPGRTTLATTYTYFGQGRDLLVIPTSELPKTIQYMGANVQNNDIPIVACRGMMKVMKLGELMARIEGGKEYYGQESEWNIVIADNLEVPAYKISFGDFNREGHFVPKELGNISMLQSIVQNAYDTHKSDPPTQLQGGVSAHECRIGGRKKRRKTKRKNGTTTTRRYRLKTLVSRRTYPVQPSQPK